MSTYKELKQQIDELSARAEEARRQEVAGVVAEIRSKMVEFGLSVEDIAPRRGGLLAKRPLALGSVAPKYRHPTTGETWTGRGKMPRWMAAEVAEGKSKDAFLIV